MEKTEILKARVSEALHRDFLEICNAVGRTPAAQLRALIEQFVAERRELTEDDVKIFVDRPKGYDFGAWRARISLRSPDAMRFMGAPVPFALPRLPARRVHPDDGFAVAAANWDGTGSGLAGVFVDGVWEGHIYTNGIAEDKNPTPIEAVAHALKAAVLERIVAFQGEGNDSRTAL